MTVDDFSNTDEELEGRKQIEEKIVEEIASTEHSIDSIIWDKTDKSTSDPTHYALRVSIAGRSFRLYVSEEWVRDYHGGVGDGVVTIDAFIRALPKQLT